MAGAYGAGRVYRRGRQFWISFYADVAGRAQEIREPAGAVERDARALLVSRRLEVQAHRRGLVRFAPGREKLTLVSLVADVLEDMRLRGKVSARSDACRAGHLEEFFGSTRATTVTADSLAAYVGWRREAGASDKTIDHELSLVRRAYRRDGAPPGPRVPLLQSKNANARRGFLTREQFDALLKALPKAEADFRDLLEWFFLTGQRPSEIARLRWADLDGDTLRLAAADTKTGYARSVPVIGELKKIIQRRRREKNGEKIFHLRGRHATASSGGFPKREYGIWREACRVAGLEGTLPYDLRRSAVRTLIRAGVSEHVAMTISGHRTRSMLDRYNITDDRDLRDAFAKVAAFKGGQKHTQAR